MTVLSQDRHAHIAFMNQRSLSWKQTDVMHVADYKRFQVLDGAGLRCSLYVSFCPFNCKGCYNKVAQKRSFGVPYNREIEDLIISDLSLPHVAGLTLCGGEPMLSAKHILPLVQRIREEVPNATIWSYTGYLYETLLKCTDERYLLLKMIDVLVDGQFIEELVDHSHVNPFAGSTNQRVINVSYSLAKKKVVLVNQYNEAG
ncbi:anaerobic ribonucleoside-triphosphate reductase activating protein [Corynebacterium kroppenstedtii]|jgi:anaerobic ribonucleoside-triphosphate reductase activating protein|uniref:Anaerobic ribonucleoside-triphosphate reductase-activating protein n=2 Tax=Corynebacterium kroppenstedtii TaxID=161879 RepID=A0A2W5SL79_9CORY|nr:MAG: anaerobic ribonucleoside-triphosphate reductase activating protein [Corynebacterium kroppenstedtii]